MENKTRKVIKSAKSTMRYSDANEMLDEALNALLFDVNVLSKEATDDADEQVNIQMNIASKVTAVVNAATIKGAFISLEDYLEMSGLDKLGAYVEEEDLEC